MNIGIYGIGNFGFAIIRHLSLAHINNKKIDIIAFDRNSVVVSSLLKTRKHPFHHKKISIEENVRFLKSPKEIFQKSDIIILAVTSDAIKEVVKKNQKYINKKLIIVNTAKALNVSDGRPFSEIILNFPGIKKNKCEYAVFSGGTIASDLFNLEPLGADIGCKDIKSLNMLKKIFISNNLNIYTSTHVKSIEYAGAFKNVVSILAGIINGLDMSYGSETHFITRAAKEITKLLSEKIKINNEIFSINSQSWGNDLWLSCTGNTRNREFGKLIGKGYSPRKAILIMSKKHKSVEGINTIKSLIKFKKINNFPILKSVYNIVIKNYNPKKEIIKLMKLNRI